MKALIQILLRLLGGKKGKFKALPKEQVETSSALGDEEIQEAEGHEDYRGLLEKEPEEKTPEDEGISQVELVLKRGDSGPKVKEYQEWLEALGYELSRFGADGSFGDESFSETREFQDDHALVDDEDCLVLHGVGRQTYDRVKELASKLPEPPKPTVSSILPPTGTKVLSLSNGVKLYDITEQHGGKKRKRKRSWKDVKGITLHQTATNFGGNVMRYKNISAHVGVTPDGKGVLMNPIEWVVYHGNAFNSKDVGIEIDGHFAGIEGNLKTYWRPKSQPDRQPMSVSEAQVNATLAIINWIIKTVADHGGKIEYIHAHRQSSKSRTSDPGSKVWQTIALEAKKRWGLVDGGPKFKLGGHPIPREWDPSYTASYYPW